MIVAASALSACTFGPRDPETPPNEEGDKLAKATAHEGESKVDKDGFRTPDAKRVMEDDAAVTEPGDATAPSDAAEADNTAEPGDVSKDSAAPEQPNATDGKTATPSKK